MKRSGSITNHSIETAYQFIGMTSPWDLSDFKLSLPNQDQCTERFAHDMDRQEFVGLKTGPGGPVNNFP